MKNQLFKSLIVFTSCCSVWFLTSFCTQNKPSTKDEAMIIAQQFLVDNGYTSLPGDESKIQYELMEGGESAEKIFSQRKNTLSPLAYYFSESETEWSFGFLSTKVKVEELSAEDWKKDLAGRVVIVSKTTGECRMAHKDPLFSHFTKL